jgi:hypothetical protein
MNAVSTRGKRLPEFAAIGRPLWQPKGKKMARFFRSGADLGGSGPSRSKRPRKRCTESLALQMRSSLILIERPSREKPDRAGLALSFGPWAGDGGGAVLFSRFWQSQGGGVRLSTESRRLLRMPVCRGGGRTPWRTGGGQGCRGQTKGRDTWTTYYPAILVRWCRILRQSFISGDPTVRVEVTTVYVL